MQHTANIRYITRKHLNVAAWDNCIQTATNSLIYARSEYLDLVCGEWDALVYKDYEAVFPLVWRKKMGISYLYYPPFCAGLGAFGNDPNKELVSAFLESIPRKFRYWDFPLNHGNNYTLEPFELTLRTNYILPLQRDYAQISSGYRENLVRNIRRSVSLGCITDKGFPVSAVIDLAKTYTPGSPVEPEAYDRFEQLFTRMMARQEAITYGIRARDGNLLASAAFLFDHQRAYYLLVGNHPDGKTSGASHALIDAFIADHAGRAITLDFEGTDIRNLAFFYTSFGATAEYYPAIKHNRLPLPVKWLKK